MTQNPKIDDETLGKVLLQMEREGKIAIDPNGVVRLLSPSETTPKDTLHDTQ